MRSSELHLSSSGVGEPLPSRSRLPVAGESLSPFSTWLSSWRLQSLVGELSNSGLPFSFSCSLLSVLSSCLPSMFSRKSVRLLSSSSGGSIVTSVVFTLESPCPSTKSSELFSNIYSFTVCVPLSRFDASVETSPKWVRLTTNSIPLRISFSKSLLLLRRASFACSNFFIALRKLSLYSP